jgi:cation transport ATPase
MVLGHWLEMRAISQARGALNALAALLPDTAERVTGDETQTVPLSALQPGDIVSSGLERGSRRMGQSLRGRPILTSR